MHECQQGKSRDVVGRAQAHNLEQQEVVDTRRIGQGKFTPGEFAMFVVSACR